MTMVTLKAAIQKLWTDPVVSRILGSIGYAALVSLAGTLAPWHILEHSSIILISSLLGAMEGFLLFLIFRPATKLARPGRGQTLEIYFSAGGGGPPGAAAGFVPAAGAVIGSTAPWWHVKHVTYILAWLAALAPAFAPA